MFKKQIPGQPQKHWQLSLRVHEGWRDIPGNKANVMLAFFFLRKKNEENNQCVSPQKMIMK